MDVQERLQRAWQSSGSLLCIGLDPDPDRLPAPLRGEPDAVFRFCTAIVDATADLACAVKPQFAHFAALGAEDVLERVCRHVRERHPHVLLLLDAKRGDIGSTAERYAVEAYERYGAHAVTVNPYLGTDAVEPFLRHEDRGVFVLCRTSNPGGADLQDLLVDGRPLYEHVAELVVTRWNRRHQCGLVVGATYPEELARVRELAGDDVPLLVPGVGAQGGDPATVAELGADRRGTGLVVSSSRAVLYASPGEDFATAARQVAEATRNALAAGAQAAPGTLRRDR